MQATFGRALASQWHPWQARGALTWLAARATLSRRERVLYSRARSRVVIQSRGAPDSSTRTSALSLAWNRTRSRIFLIVRAAGRDRDGDLVRLDPLQGQRVVIVEQRRLEPPLQCLQGPGEFDSVDLGVQEFVQHRQHFAVRFLQRPADRPGIDAGLSRQDREQRRGAGLLLRLQNQPVRGATARPTRFRCSGLALRRARPRHRGRTGSRSRRPQVRCSAAGGVFPRPRRASRPWSRNRSAWRARRARRRAVCRSAQRPPCAGDPFDAVGFERGAELFQLPDIVGAEGPALQSQPIPPVENADELVACRIARAVDLDIGLVLGFDAADSDVLDAGVGERLDQLLICRPAPLAVGGDLQFDANDYLAKPFELAELTARVEALLRRLDPTCRSQGCRSTISKSI